MVVLLIVLFVPDLSCNVLSGLLGRDCFAVFSVRRDGFLPF